MSRLDRESRAWLEAELQLVEYGEVGIIFQIEGGEIKKRETVLKVKTEIRGGEGK